VNKEPAPHGLRHPPKPTYSAGERVTASKMNAAAAHADWSTDKPMVYVYLGSNVTMTTVETLTWNSSLSSLSNVTPTLAVQRITVSYTGIWEWTVQIGLDDSPASSNPVFLRMYTGNDTSPGSRIAGDHCLRYSGQINYAQCGARVSMTADTTWVRIGVSTSTSGVVLYGSSRETWLAGRLVGRP
jgi:hypothetical protein